MRTAIIVSVLLASPAAWAQNRNVSPTGYGRILFPGGGGPGQAVTTTGAPTSGYGRILFPGTAAPAVVRNPNSSFSQVVTQPPQVQHPDHNKQNVVLYPVFFGGGYYNYGPPPPLFMDNFDRKQNDPVPPGSLFMENFSGGRNTRPASSSAQDQSPVIILNQYFEPATAPTPAAAAAAARPVTPVVSGPVSYNTTPDPVIFLIAMRDHTIYAASSYFVENETLNYTTVQGSQNTVSLDLVDRDLSRRLNRERSVAFGLPSN